MNEEIKYIHNFTSDEKLKMFGYGEWVEEPDQALFKHLGYWCSVRRNHNGCFCGYVQIPEDHPYYKKSYHDIDLDVHGGLTFGEMVELIGDFGACDLSRMGYWIGFDCGHLSDVVPVSYRERLRIEMVMGDWCKSMNVPIKFKPKYRNIEYAIDQCKHLVHQAYLEASVKNKE